MFKINKDGLEIIKRNEGLVLQAYLCPANIPTIGYGTTKGITIEDVKNKKKISVAEAEYLLKRDLKEFEFALNSLINKDITNDNEFSAMLSLMYNIGIEGFKKSSVLRLHNLNKKNEAARAFNFWNKARVNGVLKELKGLVKRRIEEANLYLKKDITLMHNVDELTEEEKENKLMVQKVEFESNISDSSINKSAIIGGIGSGGILLNEVDTILNTASNVKSTATVLGEWLIPIACISIIIACCYIIYNRYKQRKDGWA